MEQNNVNLILPAPGEEEKWATCPGYEAYEVSTFGNVRNKKTQRMLKSRTSATGGYPQVHLRSGIEHYNGKYISVHRLVAFAFCGNDDPENKIEVDHKDRCRTNNYYKNLRWVTPQENQSNRTKTRKKYIFKKRTPIALVNPVTEELIQIFKSPTEAGEILNLSPNVIVSSIQCEGIRFRIGKFVLVEQLKKT